MTKRILIIALIALLAGCTEKTEFGQCVGTFDEKNPTLIYKLSAWNLLLGIVFIELIVPPIAVIVDETFCPVGKK